MYGDLLAFKRPEGQRDYETAKHVYERALELDPTHIDVSARRVHARSSAKRAVVVVARVGSWVVLGEICEAGLGVWAVAWSV